MIDLLIKTAKYFTNLSDVKRVIFFMSLSIIFLTYFFIKRDGQNQAQHSELKVEYKKRLDTCEVKNVKYLSEKESLQNIIFQLKIDSAVTSASSEIKLAKDLAKEVKKVEIKVKKTTRSLNNKLNKLNNEK